MDAQTESPALVDVLDGLCTVCGVKTAFKGFTDNPRESGNCQHCGSFNRPRQLAWAIRRSLRLPLEGPLCLPTGFSVYNTESTGALHHALRKAARRPLPLVAETRWWQKKVAPLIAPEYQFSEYFGPEFVGGTEVRGVRHENLEALSFSDARFDLVLSSDVLEHMPHPYTAHAEIFRVLKPGGRHLFTVPCNLGMGLDDVRAQIVDGEVVYHGEKLYHGDPVRPDEGILVWNIFGLEMFSRLRQIGFETKVWVLREPRLGILGDNPIVFEAIKPAH